MGLFTDSVPIKSLVSLSSRGGSVNGTSTGNNSKSNASSTNTTNNNGQSLSVPFSMPSSPATSIVHQRQQQQQQQPQKLQHQQQQQQQQQQRSKKNDKAGIMSAITSTSTTIIAATTTPSMNKTNNNHHKSPSASSSSKREVGGRNSREGNGSCSMQQLSTSWEFIKLSERPIHDFNSLSDEKDEPQDLTPPRYIKISDGKISLCPPKPPQSSSTILSSLSATSNQTSSYDHNRDQEVLIARIVELEEALCRLQEKVNNSQSNSPTLEKDLKEQLESMNRAMKSKERKAMQACRDQKLLQARFTRQENLLHLMQQENKSLQQRIRQYEHCLDDVMRKVVDAIVAEDSLREEVSMLKSRVRDLEAQNAALCAKGRDEGYCTMSTGQPQPSNSHLEDLPEEPEQWLMSGSGIDIALCGGAGGGNGEPTSCSAGDMEDWSMSQEELGVITLDDDPNDREIDWIWNSNSYLNSTMIDSQSEGISQLLQETIVYSEDEEIACIDFTRDFYKLVNIPSGSTKSLYSHVEADTDDDDDDDDEEDKTSSDSDRNCRNNRYHSRNQRSHRDEASPTPSEAGQAQVASCSSTTSSCDTSTAEQTNKSFVKSSVECIEKTKSLNHKLMSVTAAPPAATTTTTPTTTTTATTANTSLTLNHELIENENFINNVRSSTTNSSSSSSSSSSSTIPTTTSALVNCAASIPVNKYPSWKRSNGWKRLGGPQNKKHNFSDPLKYQYQQYHPSKIVSTQMTSTNSVKETVTAAAIKTTTVAPIAATQSKIPPPVPVRRSYAS